MGLILLHDFFLMWHMEAFALTFWTGSSSQSLARLSWYIQHCLIHCLWLCWECILSHSQSPSRWSMLCAFFSFFSSFCVDNTSWEADFAAYKELCFLFVDTPLKAANGNTGLGAEGEEWKRRKERDLRRSFLKTVQPMNLRNLSA